MKNCNTWQYAKQGWLLCTTKHIVQILTVAIWQLQFERFPTKHVHISRTCAFNCFIHMYYVLLKAKKTYLAYNANTTRRNEFFQMQYYKWKTPAEASILHLNVRELSNLYLGSIFSSKELQFFRFWDHKSAPHPKHIKFKGNSTFFLCKYSV